MLDAGVFCMLSGFRTGKNVIENRTYLVDAAASYPNSIPNSRDHLYNRKQEMDYFLQCIDHRKFFLENCVKVIRENGRGPYLNRLLDLCYINIFLGELPRQ